ncbi:hypothetical protein BT69DRAFT_1286710 [Atractiella rhizophila]|nr:hypothetical protein BT69DRAFT_1286710 [Atractiella rhizophila]
MSPSPSSVALCAPLEYIRSFPDPQTHLSISSSFRDLQISPPYADNTTPPASLVRLRCMVIDTTRGEEIVPTGFRYVDKIELEDDGGNVEQAEWEERSVIIVEDVDSGWIRENLGMKTERSYSRYILKLYDPTLANSLRSTSLLQCVGIFYPPSDPSSMVRGNSVSVEDHLASLDMEDYLVTQNGDEKLPTVHVLYMEPLDDLSLPIPATEEFETLREETLRYLTDGLSGDQHAAEWLLLSVISRIHTRSPPLGRLSIALSLPTATTHVPPIFESLAQLLPRFFTLHTSLGYLNNPSIKLSPISDGDSLTKGLLQVPDGQIVGVDMTHLSEGALNEGGLKNLHALQTAVREQKLDYTFPFSSFSFPTDIGFIVLSHGTPIVVTDAVVSVLPSDSPMQHEVRSGESLDRLRGYIQHLSSSANDKEVELSPTLSETIASDFSAWRKENVVQVVEGDLGRRITLMRLLTLSLGEKHLTEELWRRAVKMDKERLSRIGAKQ